MDLAAYHITVRVELYPKKRIKEKKVHRQCEMDKGMEAG